MIQILLSGVAALAMVGICDARPLESRSRVGDKFNLYAWGNNIPGLDVFYANGRSSCVGLARLQTLIILAQGPLSLQTPRRPLGRAVLFPSLVS